MTPRAARLAKLGIGSLLLAALAAGARAEKPLDLVWSEEDEGGLPRNPEWRWSRENPGAYPDVTKLCALPSRKPFADCTDQPTTVDEASGVTRLICKVDRKWAKLGIPGHVNWRNVTYEGRVDWEGLSIDGDVNLHLAPRGKAALTSARTRYMGLEFDSFETVEHFDTPWWNDLYDQAHAGTAGRLVDGRDFVVTGLLGLDCEHGCYTELHPVQAMAVGAGPSAEGRDVWAYFARNVGNEGFCSRYLHAIDGTRLTIRIPWKERATSVRVANPHGVPIAVANRKGVKPPRIYWAKGEGILLAFTFPPLDAKLSPRVMVHGELHLEWEPKEAITVARGEPTPPEARGDEEKKDSAERRLEALDTKKATRKPRARERGVSTRGDRVPLTVSEPKQVDSLKDAEPAPRPAARRAAPPVVAEDKLARDREKLRTLCKQYRGELPDMPGVCAKLGVGKPRGRPR